MGREDKGKDKKRVGLAIIFHSGSYDRIHHGLSIALAALALGREVRLLFTYGALEYLSRGASIPLSASISVYKPKPRGG